MREIKFRAWDKWRGNMIQPNDGDFIGWHAMKNWKDCLEVMQFTGLHDKNGVEIYEGDIVFVRKAKEQREVVFHGGAFCVVSGGDHYTLNQTRAEGLEVVGNIYENPELLK